MEEIIKKGEEGGNPTTTEITPNTATAEGGKASESGAKGSSDKTFTQEEMNKIIDERLKRVYEKIENANKSVEELSQENKNLKRDLLLKESNIKSEKLDDVITYFKGKEMEFTKENLDKVLETHSEWLGVNEGVQVVVGSSQSSAQKMSEQEKAEQELLKKVFGENGLKPKNVKMY